MLILKHKFSTALVPTPTLVELKNKIYALKTSTWAIIARFEQIIGYYNPLDEYGYETTAECEPEWDGSNVHKLTRTLSFSWVSMNLFLCNNTN